jgi:hypothetical protein
VAAYQVEEDQPIGFQLSSAPLRAALWIDRLHRTRTRRLILPADNIRQSAQQQSNTHMPKQCNYLSKIPAQYSGAEFVKFEVLYRGLNNLYSGVQSKVWVYGVPFPLMAKQQLDPPK